MTHYNLSLRQAGLIRLCGEWQKCLRPHEDLGTLDFSIWGPSPREIRELAVKDTSGEWSGADSPSSATLEGEDDSAVSDDDEGHDSDEYDDVYISDVLEALDGIPFPDGSDFSHVPSPSYTLYDDDDDDIF